MNITTYPRGKFRISVMKVADIAARVWENREPNFGIGAYGATDYTRRMLTSAAYDAIDLGSHSDDHEGTGEFSAECRDLANAWAPDYEEGLPRDARDELESDVEGFVSMAWPYLAKELITPERAGELFILDRNSAGAGFWDQGYANGDALSTIAKTFGAYAVGITGHGNESDGCDKCGEPIEHVTGPVQDIADEWVHADRSATDHKPSGPVRVYGHHI